MKLIPLTRGKFAKVSDVDFVRVKAFKWNAYKKHDVWYAKRNIRVCKGKQRQTTQSLHAFILPGVKLIDHRDRDGLNNQRRNLRKATNSLNAANSKKFRTNTSGFKGVHWHEPSCTWHARIQINGARIHLGDFSSVEEAAQAYTRAAKKYFGGFARL